MLTHLKSVQANLTDLFAPVTVVISILNAVVGVKHL